MWSEHDRPPIKTDVETDTYLLVRLRPLNAFSFVGVVVVVVGVRVTSIMELRGVEVKVIRLAPLFCWVDTFFNFLSH